MNQKTKKKLAIVLTILAFLIGGTSLSQGLGNLLESLVGPELLGPYEVVRIVDGDTIIVELDGGEEKLRMIGVDTPESVHNDLEKNVPYGKVSSDYTKDMLEGREVWLEMDVEERDRYGRLLAYVYLDGEMFNRMLLEEGHATIITVPPNVKYAEEFEGLQEEARREGRGLWKEAWK